MSWTKKQIVLEALSEIGIASYEFDVSSDELSSATKRLDMMMASFDGMGRALSYPLPTSPEDTDPASESNIPDYAVSAVALNLAINLAPKYGKQVSIDTRRNAARAMNAVMMRVSQPQKLKLPRTMPLGAGHKPWREDRNYLYKEEDPATMVGGTIEEIITND